MAFVALSYFSQVLSSLFEAVVGQVLEVFSVSSLIGSYLVFYTNSIGKFLFFAVNTIFTVIKIVLKDFVIFLNDVLSIISIVHEILLSYLTNAFEAIIAICIKLKEIVKYCLNLPYSFYCNISLAVENCALCVVNAANLLKRAITWLGSGIWSTLTFIPYSFVNLLYFTALSCIDLAFFMFESIIGLIIGTLSRLRDTSSELLHFFMDIPREACGGLAIGVLLIWLIFKKKRILMTYIATVYRLHLDATVILFLFLRQTCQFVMHQVYFYLRHCVFWRRASASENGVANGLFSANENFSVASTSQQHDISSYASNLKKKLDAELEEKMCTVCQERRKTVIVLPCRHLCMCKECVLIVERVSRKCPLCRRHIAKTMGVYL